MWLGVGPLAALVTNSPPEGISAKEAFSHAGPNTPKHGGSPGRKQAVLCSGVGVTPLSCMASNGAAVWGPSEM